MDWVKEFKPDRVMFIYLWIYFRTQHGFRKDQNTFKHTQNDKFFYQNMIDFAKGIENITKNGA